MTFPAGSQFIVQGASRGIGFAITNQILARDSDSFVLATCRGSPSQAKELASLQEKYGNRLRILSMDVESETSVETAALEARAIACDVDRIINVAGVLHEKGLAPEKRLSDISPSNFEKVMRVNALGALLVAKWFSPLMTKDRPSQFINISARVGSISDNQLGGWYSYRCSKAALNMITRNLSIELKRKLPKVICTAIHPGTTDTNLSKPFQRNVRLDRLSTSQETAVKILDVTDKLTCRHNGSFLSTDGVPIPW
tara:strand:- start:313 stop:1077 length:765 start_codon:yes stop_codon:yes gene_type:complete